MWIGKGFTQTAPFKVQSEPREVVGVLQGEALDFGDFQELLGHCRFRDCKHDREPGCALLKALEDGRIQPQRMASYRHILSSLPESDY